MSGQDGKWQRVYACKHCDTWAFFPHILQLCPGYGKENDPPLATARRQTTTGMWWWKKTEVEWRD